MADKVTLRFNDGETYVHVDAEGVSIDISHTVEPKKLTAKQSMLVAKATPANLE